MGEYYGRDESYNPYSGWGFSECQATYALYGRNIFFRSVELPGPVYKGDPVSFLVMQDTNGVRAVGVIGVMSDLARRPKRRKPSARDRLDWRLTCKAAAKAEGEKKRK